MGNIDKFDMTASRYDTPERIGISNIIAGQIRRVVADGRGKTAIDYGCGTGLVGLRKSAEKCKVHFSSCTAL